MNKLELKIKGMHCQSCEVLLERQLKKIKGIDKADLNFTTGNAMTLYSFAHCI